MTDEDWKTVETELQSILGRVKLKIDGYNVTIAYVRESPMKYCLAIYIDNVFEGKWIREDCEIRRRFCSKHTCSLLSQKDKQRLKREKKAFREEMLARATYHYWTPYWTSFRSLKNHLVKNNTSIELVKAD